MTQSILVAGGAGYIGSHVCKVLQAGGYRPVVLDNLSTGYEDFVRWGPFVNADIDDAHAVRHAVEQYNIEAVIDFTGSIEVAESVANPLKYYNDNFAQKITFIRTLKDTGIRAFVFSSTAAVYGEPVTVPIPENHQTVPKNPYGASKLFFEQLLKDFHAAEDFPWIALRYFNACGASPDGEIGESHDPETHLLARACLAALGTGPALNVFGTDYPTPDGTAIRDYIHVMDLASAHLLAVKALLDGLTPSIFNLGNGKGTSIREILSTFEQLQLPVPHQFGARRAGDPAQLIADASAARRVLGWTPKNDIETVIRSAHQWHKSKI